MAFIHCNDSARFVRFYEGKGLDRPYCNQCVYFATEIGTSRGLCRKHGAYVSLYSSCSDYDRRVNSSTPILQVEEIKAKFRFGLDDLLKST